MIKKQMKTSKKYDSGNYPFIIESWKKDFVHLIPQSKRRIELIKYVELVDWRRIGHLVFSETESIMKKIDVPESRDSLRLNSSIVEGIILANINKQLHYLFLQYLSNINKNDTKSLKNKKIKSMIHRVESEVRQIRSVFNTILDVGSLKWIQDSDEFNVKINEVQKDLIKYDRFRQHDFKDDNLEFYGKVYKKNDEYRKKEGHDNFKHMVRKTLKYASEKKVDSRYGAFWTFKKNHKIYTYPQFENFLSAYREQIKNQLSAG